MIMKKIWIFLLLAGILISCSEEKLDTANSVFKDTIERNEFDQWLIKNYTTPYNIEFKYRLEDKESQMQYNLIPAEYDKSVAIAKLAKFLWFESYAELVGDKFIRTYSPRLIHLIGSPAYNVGSGSIVLGTAEGGLKVTLYNVNIIDVKNPNMELLNYYFFKTMHHEFAHILHQTKNYPVEFNLISADSYTSTDWVNQTLEQALKKGFISPYGSSETQEDFVELIAVYVTNSKAYWDSLMGIAGDTGKPIIEQKLTIVKNYLSNSWNIDLDKLRDIVQRRSSEVSKLDLQSLN